MQALGLIETKGLLPAIISADSMAKAANIKIIDKTYIGGGLVTISITGDVGAVQAAIDIGIAVVKNMDVEFLVSQHIIPRPHEDLGSMILSSSISEEKQEAEIVNIEEVEEEVEIEEETIEEEVQEKKELDIDNKINLDNIILNKGIEDGIKGLRKLKVVELRNLAREYDEFGIKGREISNAGKNLLIKEFEKHYKNKEIVK